MKILLRAPTRRALRCCVLLALAASSIACGSRAPTLPPLRLEPPTVPGAVVDQRGATAVVRFGEFAPEVVEEGTTVRVDAVEILLYVEDYPALTPELLASALETERQDRIRAAREARRTARDALERQRAAQEAAEAAALGEEPAELEAELPPTEEEDPEDFLSEDELALRSVPRVAIQAWREAELRPDAILSTARRLDPALQRLWDLLELPTAIVDPTAPPESPDPLVVITEARRLDRSLDYPTAMPLEEFLDDAEVLASIPFDELDTYRFGKTFEYEFPIEVLPESIRNRYLVVVRGLSERGREGNVRAVMTLAPSLVPTAPTELTVELVEKGVLLRWQAPAVDLEGAPVPEEDVLFNVYRRIAGEGSPWLKLTANPITQRALLDASVEWGTNYVYAVRPILGPLVRDDTPVPLTTQLSVPEVTAAAAAAAETAAETIADSPRAVKEGQAAVTDVVNTSDDFHPDPVTNLTATRVSERVTLRWRASASSDVVGYRVYRHPTPSPMLPMGRVGAVSPLAGVPFLAEADRVFRVVDSMIRTARYGATELRRAQNRLVEDGWELLSNVVITANRYIDVSSDPATEWVYLVEALDRSFNVSYPVTVVVRASEQP